MSADELLNALRAAHLVEPGNVDVRNLLACTLADHGLHEEALAHATEILGTHPDNRAALETAERACMALGLAERGNAYSRVLSALGPARAGSDAEPPDDRAVPDSADDLIASWATAGPAAPTEPEIGSFDEAVVTLEQVGGLEDVKARLARSLFAPIRHPELAAEFGATSRGGVVLYGPPGCGKTFLAKAIAGELGARFYSVGITDVLDMWLGNSERNISAVFDVAREHTPCVLFLDEIDALGMQRTALRFAPAMRTVVNQLLSELDGIGSDNAGVFVLAATNHPWDIDNALMRPGRLGQLMFVPPPDYEARAHILWVNLVNRPRTDDLDVWAVAKRTEGLSGADLRAACEMAAEAAMDASLASGSIVPVDTRRLLAAAASCRSSIGAWVDQARNVARFSNTDGRYDDLAEWLRRR